MSPGSLRQARKFKLGVTLAHQFLDQLTPALRASMMTNPGIRFAGGVSQKDANALDSDMAGIYARGDDHGHGEAENAPVTFAILTTDANEIMQPIHDRMPVILPLGHEKEWLPPTPTGMFIFPRFPAELMTTYPVSPEVNKASFNEPAALLPLEPTIQ